ncbi:MAG: amino acid adenylation domain-containing protein, partial [Spongiibacteraceae bacterium]|nr:amino acid adenylation domain-containing protein [Spongiibacteraceae bacterium]
GFRFFIPLAGCSLKYPDLSLNDDPDGQFKKYIESQENYFFNVKHPLIKSTLIKLAPAKYIWHNDMHHLICDGYSTQEYARRMSIIYRRIKNKKTLDDLSFTQFQDYLRSSGVYAKTERYKKDKKFWENKLASPVEPLSLFGQHSSGKTTKVRQIERDLGAELSAQLSSIARAEAGDRDTDESSFFLLLATLTVIFLYRLTGNKDITLGMASHNRRSKSDKMNIGPLSNALPVRIGIESHNSFTDLFKKLSLEVRNCIRHGRVAPLNKTYHAVVNFHINSMDDIVDENDKKMGGFCGVPFKPFWIHPGHDLNPVTVQLIDLDNTGSVILKLDLSNEIFNPDEADQFFENFIELLKGFVAKPNCPITELPLITQKERSRLVYQWNRNTVDKCRPVCVVQAVENAVKNKPNARALIYAKQSLSYLELNQKANRLAHCLIKKGAGPEVSIAVCMERSADFIISILAVLKCGSAYVPLDPQYPQERLEYVCRDSSARIVLVNKKTRNTIGDDGLEIFSIDENGRELESMPVDNPGIACLPLNCAYLIYTSGTTGQAKGVRIQHQGLAYLLDWHRQAFSLHQGDHATQLAGLSFDASVWEIWPVLASGAILYITCDEDRASPENLYSFLNRYRINISFVPTTMVARLLELDWSGNQSLRFLLTGGDRLTSFVPASLPFVLVNNYGPTENTVVTTSAPVGITAGLASIPSIGRPINNNRLYVLDKHMQLLPSGIAGELYIGGPSLSPGYHNSPDLTAQNFVPDPFCEQAGNRLYRSGDLVRYLSDGSLEFLERTDNQLKIRGFRIETAEIETVICCSHAAVQQAAVICHGDTDLEKELIAYTVLSEDFILDEADSIASMEADTTSEWESVYDQVYSQNEIAISADALDGFDVSKITSDDPSFDISGWNSSYTGLPIDAEEMRVWRDSTCERIRELNPRNVYEIGCGSGLILFPLAPDCREYYATDFSEQALASIKRRLPSTDMKETKIHLIKALADSSAPILGSSIDTFIMNSVAQYFPSEKYLRKVIKNAVENCAPGGQLFIGDVRDLRYIEEFHAAVVLASASDSSDRKELWALLQQGASEEQELLLDPEFFA